MFPLGLILVVFAGAELFTGNNAVLIPGLLNRKYGTGPVLRNWALVYVGNFVGALFFVYIMAHLAGIVSPEPWHSAIVNIAEAKTAMPWGTVFVKGIGANWFVCLAVWLACPAAAQPGNSSGFGFPSCVLWLWATNTVSPTCSLSRWVCCKGPR